MAISGLTSRLNPGVGSLRLQSLRNQSPHRVNRRFRPLWRPSLGEISDRVPATLCNSLKSLSQDTRQGTTQRFMSLTPKLLSSNAACRLLPCSRILRNVAAPDQDEPTNQILTSKWRHQWTHQQHLSTPVCN